jgi:hypothetical protein
MENINKKFNELLAKVRQREFNFRWFFKKLQMSSAYFFNRHQKF